MVLQQLRHTIANIFLQVFPSEHAYSQRNTQNTRSRATRMSSISVHAVYERCIVPLISRIHHTAKARRASSKHLGPPFRSPHTLPTEVILQIAELLDEASLQALRHTNRGLFYI